MNADSHSDQMVGADSHSDPISCVRGTHYHELCHLQILHELCHLQILCELCHLQILRELCHLQILRELCHLQILREWYSQQNYCPRHYVHVMEQL